MNENLSQVGNENTKSDTQQDAPASRVYFTEGELLPWKGRWFRVSLNSEKNVIELSLIGLTEASKKKAQREARWMRSHPRSDKTRAVRIAAKLSESLSHLQPAPLSAAV
jgi:hypothetical protein